MIQPYATHRLLRSQAHCTYVMVVTAQHSHVQMLRAVVPGGSRFHIEWARDEQLAIHLAPQLNPDIVFVDGRLNGDCAPLLRRHLARALPCTSLVICHERGRLVHVAANATAMHWDEVAMLLRHWDSRPTSASLTLPPEETT